MTLNLSKPQKIFISFSHLAINIISLSRKKNVFLATKFEKENGIGRGKPGRRKTYNPFTKKTFAGNFARAGAFANSYKYFWRRDAHAFQIGLCRARIFSEKWI